MLVPKDLVWEILVWEYWRENCWYKNFRTFYCEDGWVCWLDMYCRVTNCSESIMALSCWIEQRDLVNFLFSDRNNMFKEAEKQFFPQRTVWKRTSGSTRSYEMLKSRGRIVSFYKKRKEQKSLREKFTYAGTDRFEEPLCGQRWEGPRSRTNISETYGCLTGQIPAVEMLKDPGLAPQKRG